MGSGMVLSLTLLVMVGQCMEAYPPKVLYNYEHPDTTAAGEHIITSEYLAVWIWLEIELVTLLALPLTNVLFLVFRSFARHRVSSGGSTVKDTEVAGIDSTIAIKEYVQMFCQ